MRRQAPNPNFRCPQCGGVKSERATRCGECVNRGAVYRTNRLKDLITRFGNGQTLKEIAVDWGCSVKTVEWRWAQAKALCGFQCPQDVTKYGIKKGWIAA